MRLSATISVAVFFVLGGNVLLDQWIIGQASAEFIFGTAILIAGICVGLFAFIAALGLAVSAALGEETGPDARAGDSGLTMPWRRSAEGRAGEARLNAPQTGAATLAGIDAGKQMRM